MNNTANMEKVRGWVDRAARGVVLRLGRGYNLQPQRGLSSPVHESNSWEDQLAKIVLKVDIVGVAGGAGLFGVPFLFRAPISPTRCSDS